MKTIIVHHRSGHHATNSGYSRLIDYYNNDYVINGKPSMPFRLAKNIARMSNQKVGLYNAGSVFKELELYKTLKANKNHDTLVHYLNAERDIRYILKMSKIIKNTTFCGTFHKPPITLDRLIKKNTYLKRLHGAIAVGKNQVDYIKNNFNINKVAYIPHGVDTDFFIPKPHVKTQPTLLFVGMHLRDFKAFNYAIPILAEQIKNLKVQVVINKYFLKLVNPQPYIQIFTDLNDEELRNKYQEASVLFLPMIDSTACNSILEAMACGLPIITTDVGGNKDYLSGTESVLVQNRDNDYLVEATVALLKDEDKLSEISIKTRQKALEYDWKKIATLVSNFHESLY